MLYIPPSSKRGKRKDVMYPMSQKQAQQNFRKALIEILIDLTKNEMFLCKMSANVQCTLLVLFIIETRSHC